jgi:outer membrane protein assembly factor BamE (lipoprotein component of BamABCDE complex)
MSFRPLFIAGLMLAGSGGLAACTPVTSMSGFIAVDTQPQDIKVGVDNRTSVAAKLGTPSTTGNFDKSTWYYITQTSDKMAYLQPQIKSRTVVAIRFDKDEKVAEVRSLAMKDGYDLAYEKRETPTRGRELSWIEQLLGNVGRGGMLPQENDPGQRPGDGSGRGGRP